MRLVLPLVAEKKINSRSALVRSVEDMRFSDYSHRHGKEVISVTYPEEQKDVIDVVQSLDRSISSTQYARAHRKHAVGQWLTLNNDSDLFDWRQINKSVMS